MTVLESIILGLVQGLAEFLPISSSGHLSALQYFFGIESDKVMIFTIMLHLGTLASLFVVYWSDVWALIVEFCATLKDIFTGKGFQINKNETRRLGFMIVVATIPTAIMGLLLNDIFESFYESLLAIGIGLLITGTCLWLAERLGGGDTGVKEMKFRQAFFIGVCQGVALAPGISRSGSTLVGGLTCKFDRAHAVRFAFLMSIPSVIGALVLEVPDAVQSELSGSDILPIIIGTVVAFISGVAAIKLMIKVVKNQKLFYFSIYTWIVGLFLVGYSILA